MFLMIADFQETVIVKKNTSRGIRFIPIQRDLAIECNRIFPASYNTYTLAEIFFALSGPGLLGLKKGIRQDINEQLKIELSTPGLAASQNGYFMKLLELFQREVYVWILSGELVDSHTKGAKKKLATLEMVTPFPANVGGGNDWWRMEVSINCHGLEKIPKIGSAYELLQVVEKVV
ncbi:hypothetical protein N7533_011011 [Penicillium manginii]|uniref:uncharacterized protein n=1 Tax=Penicillium manginii TaxID=203109 RepID=UPI00254760E8|nr:uncharacterized protein N7533_011011 [Penicillium manginii]KAJ5741602.1 hypothetical protein N7533_011011 [Penicillium manginii]